MSKIQIYSYFEAVLGVIGLFLIYIFPSTTPPDWNLTSGLFIDLAIYLIPMVFMAIAFSSQIVSKIDSIRSIQNKVHEFAKAFLWKSHWLQILFLSVCAGLGEEILFRGYFQTEFGIHVASIIFGALHSLSVTYFLIATAMGYYLGYVFNVTESIWVVIGIHALYDFMALMILRRLKSEDSPTQNDLHPPNHDQ